MDTPPTPMSSWPSPSSSEGFAVVCSGDGHVLRVVRAALEGIDLRDSFCDAVADAARDACNVFLSSIARGGFARSTPLRIGSRDVQCFGMCINDELFVIGVID